MYIEYGCQFCEGSVYEILIEKGENSLENGTGSINYIEICNSAINYGTLFDKVLDYSAESIGDLDEILQYYYEAAKQEKTTDQQLWNIAVIFGIYLGQTLLDTHLTEKGYSWCLGEDKVPVLEKDDRNQMSPITKAYKRLMNGPEDSVKSFYDVAIFIADGKMDS